MERIFLSKRESRGDAGLLIETESIYYYQFSCHEEERALCMMELRTLLQAEPCESYVMADIHIEPSRSPFIKYRMNVKYAVSELGDMEKLLPEDLLNPLETFKMVCLEGSTSLDYEEKRQIERQLGAMIRGKADMKKPDRWFGIVKVEELWLFGELYPSKAIWLKHQTKPQSYSTALSTRVARAVVNLAIPQIEGVSAIDPCCGIGTVLIEALSMGMDIHGIDKNPLAVTGARRNLVHFGYDPGLVTLGDMTFHQQHYDAAILDLPYNHCSVLPEDERLELLRSAGRMANRVVVVTAECIDQNIERSGLEIIDRCALHKGKFTREFLLCKSGN